MPLPSTEELYKKRKAIRSLAKKYGFRRTELCPPVSRILADKDILQVVVTLSDPQKSKTDFFARRDFERDLEKLLHTEVKVSVKDSLKTSMSQSAASRVIYGPLLKSAVRLSNLNPEVSLEEQWKEEKVVGSSSSSSPLPLRSEELLAAKAEKNMPPLPAASSKKENSEQVFAPLFMTPV